MNRLGVPKLLVGALLFVSPLLALAQPKVTRIGCLAATNIAASPHLLEAFRAGMRERGYADGRDYTVDCRSAEGRSGELEKLAADLVRSKVDIIVAWSTPATKAAKLATSTIPIVMVSISDPVGAGFVTSLARPGGNITGVVNLDAGLAAKRFQLLRQVLPKLSKVVALRNPTNPSALLQSDETHSAARSLGMDLQFFDVRDRKELESAFAAMGKARVAAITVLADPMFMSERKQIAELATRNRIPSVFARNENVDAGGLLSYGPTLTGQFHDAANYVDRIIKGAKPAELPIEQPTRLDLVINLGTAKALGLAIPHDLLLRADRTVE